MLARNLPAFDAPVPDGGYRWWYVDGLSDCGRYGVVVIAFIGSVFSPYYYRARQRGRGDPYAHCAINVALYAPGGNTWTMTERGRRQIDAGRSQLRIGPSVLSVHGDTLEITVDERSAPLFRRVRGVIRVHAPATNHRAFPLDRDGRHQWQPVAPAAHVEVDFDRPARRWQGEAYVDSNAGARPLEADFLSWHWSRRREPAATRIRYSVRDREQRTRALALSFDDTGLLVDDPLPPAVDLGTTGWGIRRETSSDGAVSVRRTLEDTPFYARSLLAEGNAAAPALAVHESLSLERFEKPWVRMLLPFRMPRIAG